MTPRLRVGSLLHFHDFVVVLDKGGLDGFVRRLQEQQRDVYARASEEAAALYLWLRRNPRLSLELLPTRGMNGEAIVLAVRGV